MRTRLLSIVFAGAASLTPVAAQDVTSHAGRPPVRTVAYQGRNRGSEQTERFSRKLKLSRNGSVTVSNVSGDIIVNGGPGDEVSIEGVKRTHGSRGDLASVQIEVIEASGRIEVRTNHTGRNDHASVDYTITMPATASLEARSISGSLKVSGVQGSVRADTISGSIIASATPRLELVKSVSGEIGLTDAGSDTDLRVNSISGSVHAKGLKARGLEIGTVSGEVTLADVFCERLGARTMSGSVEYSGSLARSGRYNMMSHSGSVRLVLPESVGFELDVSTFSGSIQSELPLTIGGRPDPGVRRRGMNNHSLHATFGDASAVLTVHTFSGSVTLTRGR